MPKLTCLILLFVLLCGCSNRPSGQNDSENKKTAMVDCLKELTTRFRIFGANLDSMLFDQAAKDATRIQASLDSVQLEKLPEEFRADFKNLKMSFIPVHELVNDADEKGNAEQLRDSFEIAIVEFGSAWEKCIEKAETLGASKEELGLTFDQMPDNGITSAMRSQINTLDAATKQYHLNVNKFPDRLLDLFVKPSSMSASTWGGPYLSEEVTKDGWGTEFRYSASEQDMQVTITSAGPDRQFDTSDDISNR